MFYFVYKTTNLVTNEYYIGVHASTSLDDGYFGSGLRMTRYIQAYGTTHLGREILEFFDTLEEAFLREAEIVTKELIESDPLCMNLKPGGSGGWANEETKLKAAMAAKDRCKYLHQNDPEWRAWFLTRIADSHITRRLNPNPNYTGWSDEARNKANSESAKKKRKDSWNKIQHQQGEKNSQYGTCWVSNGVHTIKINIKLLDEYLSNGYVRGRKLISPLQPRKEDK